MMNKGTLLRTIVDYYLQSGDFNGLPAYRMEPYSSKDLIDLIHEGLVETLSEHNVLNPHIKGFDLDISIEQHIENATGKNGQVCFYPTKKALSNVTVDSERPYTARLQKGCPQFEIIFFDIEILERYVNNPRYEMIDYGYKGSISVSEKYWKDDLNGEYVKEYGMAYKKDTKLVRAVAVFVRDLSMLSANTQMLWRSFQQCNQDEFLIEEGFIKNSIYGAFVTKHWIFSALLEEIQIINKQCDAIGIPQLFNHVYGISHDERPKGYGNILLPTLKNYYDFILVMEKLLVHNISIKTFQVDTGMIRSISRKNENGENKGSVLMLQEWLHRNVRANFDMDAVIIEPLRKIRKIRQSPAHELYSNEYDLDLFEKQKNIMEEAYEAVRAIRSLFMGHPLARNVEVPEYLLNGKEIVFY